MGQKVLPPMDCLDEIATSLSGGGRVIVVSERDVDLRKGSPPNRMVFLRMTEGSLAAGGRGGGFGERRVVRVTVYGNAEGSWAKLFETEDPLKVSGYEIPYHVSRLPFFMPDGTEEMGYGVVEPELVAAMSRASGLNPP
jgi:hypothetical protein